MEIKSLPVRIENIIRTRRNSIAIQITSEGKIIIRAPLNADQKTIEKVILKNLKWIDAKLNQIISRKAIYSPKEFVNGEGFFYLGRLYKLNIVNEQNEPLVFNNGFFLLKGFQSRARDLFIKWYKEKALEKISERVRWYAAKKDIVFNKINITNAEKRWGSCSGKGNLNFSWRLIMAPLPVIDYVVIHELVHLEEKNHSKLFWSKVKMLMPDYENQKNWLEQYGHLLRL